MSEPTEFEQMADLAHYMWANWMRYMFTCGTFNDDGTWTMNAAEASRWQHQMNTPYSKLTPEEQVSDGNIAAEWINQYRVVYKVRQEHAQLAAVTAERDAARAALWDARNEVVEFCANFDIPLEHDSYLDLAVKLDEWAELAGGPPGLADEADAALADGDAAE